MSTALHPTQAAPTETKGAETLKLQLISKPAAIVPESAPATDSLPGALAGHLAGIDDEGRVLFQEDGGQSPYAVMIGLPLADEEVAAAAHLHRRALVIPTKTQPARPVLVALLRERISAEARDKAVTELATHLNGRAVEIDAQQSLELSCGRARITLHADGRIELNGDYLLSRSRGPIKLKGATIDIN